ncbi:hypothetical protein [Pseudonocardia acidicola]|uniref:Excreted virulence factor EspC (Type VII ESX diderm) n=1 Tax=Pseudonocardia acidicola TaxID=2724939 RepID=A0ABX1SE42_9PSEU|nr:hypothetical protein [Pseudonocardia acidicola]NMH99375.1 hypothetical protein [Pseudonocardia acidicola]
MDPRPLNDIAHAIDAVAATSAYPPQGLGTDQLVVAMSDLAVIAGLIGELAARARWQLAAWATVGAHLQQAEQHAGELDRSLSHACATLAFNASPRPAA